jgi:hypothetical protein
VILLELQSCALGVDDERGDNNGDDRKRLECRGEGAVVREALVGKERRRENNGETSEKALGAAYYGRLLVRVGFLLRNDLPTSSMLNTVIKASNPKRTFMI